MEPWLKKKISNLEPKTRKKIETVFKEMHESIGILYDLATHDEKTGLYNSKFFNTALEAEISKVKRGQQQLSLMIIDVDNFKKINDTYGHIRGDEILIRLAKIVQDQIRQADIAARFGGEEFIMLLPGTKLRKTKKLASRLKNSVHKDSFLKKHKVTISGGITQFKKTDNKKTFKSRADKALFKAKKEGRDQFVFLK